MNNILSEKGISNILSFTNWYNYAAVYFMGILNIAMIGTIILGIKLDKLSLLATLSSVPIIYSRNN